MANLRLLLFFLILSIGFTTCKLDDLNDPILIPVLDEEFTLDLWENLSRNPSDRLEIHIESTSLQPCTNTRVSSSFDRSGSIFNMTLFDIVPPETCATGSAPAQGVQPLGSTDTGVAYYNLNISIKDIVLNMGRLFVTPNVYRIEMVDPIGIKWRHEELYRVPTSALWGYITYTTAEQRNNAQTWLANTIGANSLPFPMNDGYYGHFELSNNSNTVSIKAMPTEGVIPFIYTYTGDAAAIDTWVSDFQSTAAPSVTISAWDGMGRSW